MVLLLKVFLLWEVDEAGYLPQEEEEDDQNKNKKHVSQLHSESEEVDNSSSTILVMDAKVIFKRAIV